MGIKEAADRTADVVARHMVEAAEPALTEHLNEAFAYPTAELFINGERVGPVKDVEVQTPRRPDADVVVLGGDPVEVQAQTVFAIPMPPKPKEPEFVPASPKPAAPKRPPNRRERRAQWSMLKRYARSLKVRVR